MADTPTTGLTDQIARDSTIYTNVGQELIITTRDKVELCLLHHQEALEGQRNWVIPAGIFVPVILTLLTADFRDAGLKKEVWQSIFVIAAVISGVFTVGLGLRAFGTWWHLAVKSIDAVIAELKAPRTPPPVSKP
jgi:hypothetical protein